MSLASEARVRWWSILLLQLFTLGVRAGDDGLKEEITMFNGQVARYEQMLQALSAYELVTTITAVYGNSARPAERMSSTMWYDKGSFKTIQQDVVTYGNGQLSAILEPEEGIILLCAPRGVADPVLGELRKEWMTTIADMTMESSTNGTTYRMAFIPGRTYSNMDVRFDEKGWLREIRAQLSHSVELAPGSRLGAIVRPTLIWELRAPGPLPKDMKVDMRQVLVASDGVYKTTGEWSQYDVFDTRP